MTDAPTRAFPVHLQRTDENSAEIDALTARFGTAVGLRGVAHRLDRQARASRAPGRAVGRSFTWAEEDRTTPDWWPQGITGSADADDAGEVEGRRLLMVSWYSKRGEGSRVSLVDVDTLEYRHVLLVVPDAKSEAKGRLRPLAVHAGGLVWCGPYLHVAGTQRGLMTCRVEDVVEVEPSPASAGYRFVLPVRFAYDGVADRGTQKLRYSFLSLDRRTDPPTLLAGEYGVGDMTRRLVRYPLDPVTWHLRADEEGVSRPLWLDDRGASNMQGAAMIGDRYYVTRSHGPRRRGTLYTGVPGAFRAYPGALPPGPEDICYWPATDQLWSVSEHPGKRWVYAVRRDQFEHPTVLGRARWLAGRTLRRS